MVDIVDIEITQNSEDGTTLTIIANDNIGWPFSRDVNKQIKDIKFDNVVLDCTKVTYIDSSTVGIMLDYYRKGKKVKFKVNKEGNIKSVLYVYGLQKILTIEEI